MSSLIQALERLDAAVSKLEESAANMELQSQQDNDGENVVDVDFVAERLDDAISSVEGLLITDEQQEEQSYAGSDSEY